MKKILALAAFIGCALLAAPVAFADTAWVASDPNIYFDTGSVGIGGVPTNGQLDILSNAPTVSLTRADDRVTIENKDDQFLISLQDIINNTSTSLVRIFKTGTVNDGPNGGDILIGTGIPSIQTYYPTLAIGNYTFTQGTNYGNTAIGHRAFRVATGAYNTALGYEAGQNLSSGNFNAMLGNATGLTNAASSGISGTSWSGDGNTFVGVGVAASIATDAVLTGNTLIGYSAASQILQSGTHNILIGAETDLPSDGGSYQLSIGNLVYGTDISGLHKTVSPGRIGIGTALPDARLSVHANETDSNSLLFSISSGADSLYTVDTKGHHIYGGAEPAVVTCGTGTTLSGNDNRGRIKVGTGTVTTCSITFAQPWNKAPVCFANKETGSPAVVTANSSKTGVVFKATASLAGETFGFSCDGF